MAKFILSGLITDVKGRLGGTIFSSWKGRNYMRVAAETVSNAMTQTQVAVRETFADSVGAWRGLTQIQKAEWEEWAQAQGSASDAESEAGGKGIIPQKSSLQSGMNAYIGANQMILRAGFPRRNAPPQLPNPSGVAIDGINPLLGLGYIVAQVAPAFSKPDFRTRVAIWQKLDRAGAHAHIIHLGDIIDPLPAVPIPTDVDVKFCRVGTGHTVELVPIADLIPCSMWTQVVVMSEDGQKGFASALYYHRIT